MTERIAVVGAGPAGVTAARTAADAGATVTLVGAELPGGRANWHSLLPSSGPYLPDSVIEAVYTDPQIAQVGLSESAATKRGIAVRVLKVGYETAFKAALSGETTGFAKLIVHGETNRILGAGAVGSHAADVLAPVALAIQLKATLEDCSGLFEAHPSLAELPFLALEV